jgi:ferredoxin
MELISILIFALFLISGFGFFGFKLMKISRNIRLGKPVNRFDRPLERLKVMAMVALGQSKMVVRPVAGIMHIFIYLAFVITQVELIEIIIDGLTGNHRIFYHQFEGSAILRGIYVFTISFIEILSVLAFVATIVFLWRRNMLKLPRFVKSELNGWPRLDANIILFVEIYLIVCIFSMNIADQALNQGKYGFAISGMLWPYFQGLPESFLHIWEKAGWWGHYLGIIGFLFYLPTSKHFHILISFPNTYFSKLEPKGQLSNLESVTNEVKLMLDPSADPYAAPNPDAPLPSFGAKDVTDLTWKQLMDAYSCTECGRCTSECPANGTGKLLSPRKIMMDTRDRLEEVGRNIDKYGPDFKDEKTLLHSYITPEELWACTTCNACAEACPINIDPVSIIIDLRRSLVMEESAAPASLNTMFSNIENNMAPWQFSPSDRLNWVNEN